MLHKINIKQADSSSQALVVQTWKKGEKGAPDVMIEQRYLNVPADLKEDYVGENQYVVVKLRDAA